MSVCIKFDVASGSVGAPAPIYRMEELHSEQDCKHFLDVRDAANWLFERLQRGNVHCPINDTAKKALRDGNEEYFCNAVRAGFLASARKTEKHLTVSEYDREAY